MADTLYSGEYPQPLVRPTNLSVPVFSGKVTGRLRLQAIPTPAGLTVQATVENVGLTSIGVVLRECDSYAAAAARTTLSTLTLVPNGNKVVNITVSKQYLEVFGTSGKGQVRIQLLSNLRWDALAFQKTDTTYPTELYRVVSLPAVDGTIG